MEVVTVADELMVSDVLFVMGTGYGRGMGSLPVCATVAEGITAALAPSVTITVTMAGPPDVLVADTASMTN